MLHYVFFNRVLPGLVAYKDLISLLIQAGLLVATFFLIRVGAKQAKAADAQSKAAIQQVEAAKAQVDIARLQFEEMLLQGNTERRLVFKINDSNPNFVDSPAIIRNVGNGVAFDTTWRFVKHHGRAQDVLIGTLAVNQEMPIPWPTEPNYPGLPSSMICGDGIWIECNDAARKHHSVIVRGSGNGLFITYPTTEREA